MPKGWSLQFTQQAVQAVQAVVGPATHSVTQFDKLLPRHEEPAFPAHGLLRRANKAQGPEVAEAQVGPRWLTGVSTKEVMHLCSTAKHRTAAMVYV